MFTVLLVVHVLVTLALIGVVLLQRSEGGGLGIGGSQGGGMGSFMTGRGTANLLTRTTAILATIFLALSLLLALMSRGGSGGVSSIFNTPASAPATSAPLSTAPAGTTPAPATPAKPAAPSQPAAPATP